MGTLSPALWLGSVQQIRVGARLAIWHSGYQSNLCGALWFSELDPTWPTMWFKSWPQYLNKTSGSCAWVSQISTRWKSRGEEIATWLQPIEGCLFPISDSVSLSLLFSLFLLLWQMQANSAKIFSKTWLSLMHTIQQSETVLQKCSLQTKATLHSVCYLPANR